MVTSTPSTDPPAAVAEQAAAALRRRSRSYRLRQSAVDVLAVFLITQIGSIVVGIVSPDTLPYTSHANVSTALQTIPLVGIPALGVGILMISGEFDLSVGANYVFSGIVLAKLVSSGTDPFLAALACLAVGAGIGLINGIITIGLRIPSFIVTLGTTGVWVGGALLINGSGSIEFLPEASLFNSLTSGNIGVIPAEFLWFVGLGLVGWLVLQRHRIGNHIFSVGGNQQSAIANGVRVNRVKLFAFAASGFCAALAAALAASRLSIVTPDAAGELPLQAIAACVVGGLVLTGGRGTILGVMLGAALIYWIQDVLLLVGAPGYYLEAFVGALIIAAAGIYEAMRTRRT
jgi:ribose/xylose/arabinose/galactoside ABC-type transport system permease subunit